MSTDNAHRRDFFRAFVTAGITASSTALSQPAVPDMATNRINRAYEMRMRSAEIWKSLPEIPHPVNGDEVRYPDKINSFTKTLRHDPLCIVEPASYASMMRAVMTGKTEDFDAVLRGGSVRLKNPTGAHNFQLVGPDQSQYTMRAAPSMASAEQAGEMTELYWQAVARDVPFTGYDTNPVIAAACDDLSRLSDFRGPRENGKVTPATAFRGMTPGDLTGPYVSQFLLMPFRMGHIDIDQKQRSLLPGLDYMADYASFLTIQLGLGKGEGNQEETTARYPRSPRDLANVAHHDYSYSPFYHAAWKLLSYGDLALSENAPYVWSKSQDAFVNFGPVDEFDLLARAAKAAFHAAWWQKWFVHYRARPEVFAARIYNHLTKVGVYPIHEEALGSRGLDESRKKSGTALLPQAYSEGSPAHSAYPSGHATVAGAVATMLKAFFRESYVIPEPVAASADGSRLVRYQGPELTVGGELNKLASNIAMARNWAGIHWRTDGWEGMQLGEQVAIHTLRDISAGYMDDFGGFTFTRFNGERMTVCPYC
jgi:membrane-associated phospholipid phosphatase